MSAEFHHDVLITALSDIRGVAKVLLEMRDDAAVYLGSRLEDHFDDADMALVKMTGKPGVVNSPRAAGAE